MKRVLESKFILKYTVIAATSTALPKLLNAFLSFIRQEVLDPWISCLIFIATFIILCLLLELIQFFAKYLKREKTTIAVEKIKSVGQRYQYVTLEGKIEPLFTILRSEEELAESLLNKKYRPVIYYSISAKNYLNWVDFCYLSYLRDLKNELGCKIIVALHPSSETRYNLAESHKKDAQMEWFSKMVESIIPEVTIIEEEQIYKKNPKNYAVQFHSLYISQILNYVNSAELNIKDDIKNSQKFNSYLGYVESVFSVWYHAKKYVKTRQLFVLDRMNSQKIWLNSDKLTNFKNQNHFLFVSAETLTDGDGKKLNVYLKDQVLCLTDDEETMRKKLDMYDYYTLCSICRLLYNSVLQKQEISMPSEKEIRNQIVDILRKCKRDYKIETLKEGEK